MNNNNAMTMREKVLTDGTTASYVVKGNKYRIEFNNDRYDTIFFGKENGAHGACERKFNSIPGKEVCMTYGSESAHYKLR